MAAEEVQAAQHLGDREPEAQGGDGQVGAFQAQGGQAQQETKTGGQESGHR